MSAGGLSSTSPLVRYSYTFGSGFTSTCAQTALPEDCSARILPGQINAIVSELKCLTETLSPEGVWECSDLCNIGTAFNDWQNTHKLVDGLTIGGTGTVDDPFRMLAGGIGPAICGDPASAQAMAACVRSTNAPNALTIGSDGKLVVLPVNVVAAICGTDQAADSLAACMISPAAGNSLTTAPDGRLTVVAANVATNLCASATAKAVLAGCLLSTDANNMASTGADNLLTVAPADVVSGICNSAPSRNSLAQCLRSSDAANILSVGTDGRLTVEATAVAFRMCSDNEAREMLAECLVSTDSGNNLAVGGDGRLFVGDTTNVMAVNGVFNVGVTVPLLTSRQDVDQFDTVPGSDLSHWQLVAGATVSVTPHGPVQQGTWKLVTGTPPSGGTDDWVGMWERIA